MDVLVVGAGPAGATVACGLAEAGLRVTVVEKAQLPRFKPCSGGLPAKSRELIPLSDDRAEDLFEDVIHRVRLTYRNRDPVVIRSERPLVYMVRRDRFDHALISEAARRGARILDGVEVIGVDPTGSRVRVRTTRGEMSAPTGFTRRSPARSGWPRSRSWASRCKPRSRSSPTSWSSGAAPSAATSGASPTESAGSSPSPTTCQSGCSPSPSRAVGSARSCSPRMK